jgi:hypothetical protein
MKLTLLFSLIALNLLLNAAFGPTGSLVVAALCIIVGLFLIKTNRNYNA